MRFAEKFDTWVNHGPFTSLDLGIYRIIYAVCVLCVAPPIQYLSEYPDSMLKAPIGPFQLMTGYPSLATLVVLEVLRAISLGMLAVGYRTRCASISTSILLLLTFGLTYTLGKIDHTILLVLAPLIMAFSGWGDQLSVDSLRAAQIAPQLAQWPLRLLAFVIGLCFFEAAAIKVVTGWLSPSTQAVRGHFLENTVLSDAPSWFAQLALGVVNRPLWEVLDWATVLLEAGILLAVPWWRAFRIAISFAALFHLSVFLLMDIRFASNLIVYAAFVSWGLAATRIGGAEFFTKTISLNSRFLQRIIVLLAAVASVGMWSITSHSELPVVIVGWITLAGGAALGVGYLAHNLLLAVGAYRTCKQPHQGIA